MIRSAKLCYNNQMTPTKTASAGMKGDVLYNAIMRGMEQDLLTCNLKTLDEKYRGESAGEHEARMQRYKVAFARLDEIFKDVAEELTGELRELAKSARKSLHLKEQKEEAEESQKLDEMFGPSPDSDV